MKREIRKQTKKEEKNGKGKMKLRSKELVESPMTKKSTKKSTKKEAEKKEKILLVEDDDNMKESIKNAISLSIKGKTIVTAATLEEAKKVFDKNEDIGLVITDISYPEREGVEQDSSSGLSFIKYVKEKRPGLRVVGQSSSREYLERAKDAGADEVIHKHEIINEIKRIVEGIEKVKKNEPEKSEKDEKQKEVNVLIITSHEDYAQSIKRAIKMLVENAKVIDYCKHKEAGERFSPEKYTHLIVTDDFLSCEEENVKHPKTEEEAKEIERAGFKIEQQLSAGGTVHNLEHLDREGKVKKILIVDDDKYLRSHGLIRKGYEYGRAYLKTPLLLTDLIKLLKS